MNNSVYTRHNSDDIFNRSIIGGLLNLLNHSITYEQIWDDNVVETVEVPFVYNFVSNEPNERFIQDNYTFFGRECFTDKIIDGNFEMLPRFVLSYDGSQIDSNNITNRFIKGEYQVNENGQINSYVGYMYTIPLTLNFSLEGWVENYVSAFKIEQQIRDVFYKNKTFWVLYRGLKIGCCVGFPESITTGEKTVSYTFSQENQLKMTFNLVVETYQPCFDQSIKIPSSSRIEHIGYDVNVYGQSKTPLNKNVNLEFVEFDKDKTYFAGENVTLKWKASSETSELSTVMLYYVTSDNVKHIIDIVKGSMTSYEWTIPSTISSFTQPHVSVLSSIDDVDMLIEPKFRVTPDAKGNVTTGSFNIIEGGKFSRSGYVQVSCDYMDELGNVYVYDGYVADVTKDGVKEVYYYKDVVGLSDVVIMNNKKMKYKKTDYKSYITVGRAYPLDMEMCDEIHNVLII